MINQYKTYIQKLELTSISAYGKCEEICKNMVQVFPELRLVRGHYYDYAWGKREHWWLETTEGIIIDPTAIQFPSKGYLTYEELDPNTP